MTRMSPPPLAIRRRFWRRRRVVLLAPVALACIIAFDAAVAWWPYPANVDRPPAASTWIEDRNGVPLAAFAAVSGDWHLPLREDQISPHLLGAIVAVEDQRFYQHRGVDWRGVAAAAWQDLTTLSARRGASTLTMQLYRLRDPAVRSFTAKIAQAVRACQIERISSKRQILVDYLNRAPFGGNLTGAGAASWRYFGRPCRELSLGQAALLAGLPQSPSRLRLDRYPERARQRRDHVLDRMLACGMIADAQRREAAREPIDARWRELPQYMTDPSQSVDGLLPTLTRWSQRSPGETIHATIDANVQKQTAAVARLCLHNLRHANVNAMAVVVLDTPTGECLAAVNCVAGNDGAASAIDLTMRPRSSGSTLKPFIYAAAFDAGVCSAGTMLDDSPAAWPGFEPSNYDREFRGPMTAAAALAQSRNLPAMTLLSKVGVDRAVEVMRGLGLATLAKAPQKYGLPLAIGGADVTPMELAQAYAAVARSAVVKPADLQPADARGSEIAVRSNGTALRSEVCLTTLRCLADPERTRVICPAAASPAPAWKTGTSSGHRDAWCAAVTGRRTVVVWLGNPDGSASDALVGGEVAAPVALQILATEDHADGEGFAPPAGFALGGGMQNSRGIELMSLAMLSPTNGQEIVRDPAIPTAQQRFPLRARTLGGGASDSELWWFVDGECVAHGAGDEPLWWTPVAGSHEVRAVDRAGRVAKASIRVSEAR